MKNFRIVSFLVVAISFLVGTAFAADSGLKPLDLEMKIVSGQVKVSHGQGTEAQTMLTPCTLYENDVIETMHESKAELKYADGTIMRMKPLAKVQVKANSLMVEKGQTWYKFTKRGTEFVIETHSLVAGIRGTEFEIMVDPRTTRLAVVEGAVSAKGARGREVLVKAGFATSSQIGKEPSKPIEFDSGKIRNRWKDAEWVSDNIDALLAEAMNCQALYGPNDSRTLAAKARHEQAQERQQKKNRK